MLHAKIGTPHREPFSQDEWREKPQQNGQQPFETEQPVPGHGEAVVVSVQGNDVVDAMCPQHRDHQQKVDLRHEDLPRQCLVRMPDLKARQQV